MGKRNLSPKTEFSRNYHPMKRPQCFFLFHNSPLSCKIPWHPEVNGQLQNQHFPYCFHVAKAQ